jgi:thiamine biosynthesis lipoprotein
MTAAAEHERRAELFGTSVRILAGGPDAPGGPPADLAAASAQAVLRHHHEALTRFEPDSPLSVLNADPREACPVPQLVADAVAAALWAAERSAGLVDPTLLPALERAGYSRSRAGVQPASLHEALAAAPPRRPAAPSPVAAWRRVTVEGDVVRRPPGLRLDLGGTAKGLAADRAAACLAGQSSFAVDAGGDIALGASPRPPSRGQTPRRVGVAHPLGPGHAVEFDLVRGAVATSGIGTRLWRTRDGFAHHLLDPATGRPAWTGVVQATAVAESTLEAELLAKLALLSGPEAGAALLAPGGGVLVLDDGEVVVAGLPAVGEELAA